MRANRAARPADSIPEIALLPRAAQESHYRFGSCCLLLQESVRESVSLGDERSLNARPPRRDTGGRPPDTEAPVYMGLPHERYLRPKFYVALSLPVLVLAMGEMLWPHLLHRVTRPISGRLQLLLTTPVFFWSGAPGRATKSGAGWPHSQAGATRQQSRPAKRRLISAATGNKFVS